LCSTGLRFIFAIRLVFFAESIYNASVITMQDIQPQKKSRLLFDIKDG